MRFAALLLLCVVVLPGCATRFPPLPTTPWDTLADAQQILVERHAGIDSVQTELSLRITTPPPERKTHRFDAALVIQGEGHLRLRAWKLGQTIFDLTVTPDGTYIAASNEMKKRAPDAEADLAALAGQLASMLRGPDYAAASFSQTDDGLVARWPNASAAIDSRSLSPKRFDFPASTPDQSIELQTDYADYAGRRWFRRVVAAGPFGNIEMTFRNVELNGPLNPRAFKPPRRAVRVESSSSPASPPASAAGTGRP